MSPSATVKVSVVVTTFNREHTLSRCLASLAAQNFLPHEYEIIVVADGCTDASAHLLRAFSPPCHFRWFQQPNQGQPAAQNLGVAYASGAIVIFIDDDCICDPGLVAAHYEAHRSAPNLLVTGAMFPHPDSPPGIPADLMSEFDHANFARLSAGDIRRCDMMLCANSSISREAALRFPFDTTYKRIHDVEAGVRLWAAGFRPAFAPKAIAFELFTKSADAMLRDARNLGQHEVILTRSHPDFKPLSAIANINQGSALKRTVRRLLVRNYVASEFLLRLVYSVFSILRRFPRMAAIACRIQKARSVLAHLHGAVQEAGSWHRLHQEFGLVTPVLMYHNVGTPRHGEYPGLTTPIPEFELQIKLLASMGYTGITPSDWLRWRNSGATLPPRPIILVFDDAYADAARNAFPILERHGFRAACMVVTRHIGRENTWDQQAGRPAFHLMSAAEIVNWSKRGIEFGGHTHTHPELPLLSRERIEDEILQCRSELTALLGAPPASFAYPFGEFNRVAESAARAHFDIAFTAWPGRLHLATDLHLAPRIFFLAGESRFGMWCRLRFGRNPFEVLRNRCKRLLGKFRWTTSRAERTSA